MTRLYLTFFLVLICGIAYGQTWYPVTTVTGSQRIHDIDVDVSYGGSVSGYPSLNECFSPYWIGNSGSSGFYTFDFSSVNAGTVLPHIIIRIRLAQINEGEAVRFSVNGTPYLLSQAGLSNLGPTCTVNGNFQPGLPGLLVAADSIYCPPGPVGTLVPWKNSIEVKIAGAIQSLTIAGSNCYNGGIGFGLQFSFVSHQSGPVCAGEDLQLHARWVGPGTTYSWTGPAGFTSSLRDPVIPNAQPENGGLYTLHMVSPTDSVTDTMYVRIKPSPNAEILVKDPVCAGETLQLSTADTLPGVLFRWTGPDGFVSAARSPVIPNVQSHHAGVYEVIAVLGDCADTGRVELDVAHPVSDSIAERICAGESYDFLGRVLQQPGIYVHRFVAANGCDSNIVVALDVLPVPAVSVVVPQQDKLCIDDTIIMHASGADRYLWREQEVVIAEVADLSYRIAHFRTELILVGLSDNGCSDTTNILLPAESCCRIFLSNAFTPNGDGRNDRFGAVTKTASYIRNYRLDIYNRWGQLVFSAFDPTDQWDGYFKGSASETGTYFYHVQGQCLEGASFRQKGELMLVR
jgi:gliding motility-associated-like protein